MSLLSRANEAYESGRYERARDLYLQSLTAHPELAETIQFNLELTKKRLSKKKPRLTPSQGSVWYWVQQLQQTRGQLPWFSNLAMHTSFEGTRDILAYAATNSRFGWDELARTLESARIPLFRSESIERIGQSMWVDAWVQLATVLYSQRHTEMDLLDSLTMFEILDDLEGKNWAQDGIQCSLYGDLLTWAGKFERAREVLSSHVPEEESWSLSENILRLNTINPNITHHEEHREIWLDEINSLLIKEGLSPIYFKDSGSISFRDLRSDCQRIEMKEMPKISIIMPLYEPNEYTDLAIESLLKQTWGNFELIVVDDASPTHDDAGHPTSYREQLRQWSKTDDRVRVVLCEKNRGTYSVRNEGLEMASGDFVTIADKDDWHHPQKLEIQARELMANPHQVANITNWVRVNEEMRFLVRSRQGQVVYPSFASIMFRRKEVLQTLGYWDEVRKAGDAEFKSRLQATFGTTLAPTRTVPLAFSLVGETNLTSQDMRPGYISADRRAYNRAYSAWHRAIADGSASAYLPKNPSSRPFVAPYSFLPQRKKDHQNHYDVIYLSEFGFLAGNSTSLLQEIQVSLNAGLKVGIVPIHNGLIRSASRQQFDPRIEELVLDNQVDRLALEDDCRTELLIIRWPASFQLDPGHNSAIRPSRIVVVANHMPYEIDGSRRSYDVHVVSQNIEDTFGLRPLWSPQSEQLDHYLAPLVPPGERTPFTWKGITDPVPSSSLKTPNFSKVPSIGRHARDFDGKWPSSTHDFQQIYPTDGSARVVIMGGVESPIKRGHLPKDPGPYWTVYEFNEKPVPEFLKELDFFVYYHGDGLVEAFGMSILEALNHGVVAVLPPHFESVFGEAALYATPSEVPRTIRNHWTSGRYEEQRRKGTQFVTEKCSPDAYLERLSQLGVNITGMATWIDSSVKV